MELQYTYDDVVAQHNYCVTSEGDVMVGAQTSDDSSTAL